MRLIPSESDEQKAFMQWLRYFHAKIADVTAYIPNEGKRSWIGGKMLKKMGMSKGFPDVAVLYPNKQYHGLFIEFKRSDQKNRQKKWSQDNWMYNLNQNGYLAVYCYSAEEAIKITTEYLSKGN